ncbi:hypothetical protein B0H14DRAFT_2708688 [Mycena olivaceomarginata]|nr:hypothetical protein B0H14DRAFT_2902727 [Mycena olivaceomarginata]KAJ7879806.1 hypothetical protein B0H14DRAFT_2708688 [Mycena olivaceomarginata]
MMNNLSTFDTVGWNHNVSYKPPHQMPGIPPRKIRLTLNLSAQVVHVIDTQYTESKVYTPMDVDDPVFYNPTNVDEPRVYTPMDVDETWETTWNRFPEDNYDSPMGDIQAPNTSDEHSLRNNYPGMSVGFDFDSVPWLTDYQMKNPLSTSNQNNLLPSAFSQHLRQKEWESWESGPLPNRQRIYKEKWAILRHNKQLLFPFQFQHVPWPIFRSDEKNIEINTPSVESFIFGETQGIPSTCESRRLAKQNLKLFHSDKFAWILDKVLLPMDRERARHCAEAVCRILTRHLD